MDIDVAASLPLLEVSARALLVDGAPGLAVLPAHLSRFRTALGREIKAGRLLTVTVTRHRVRRSSTANAFLWGVVYRELLEGLRILAQQAGERCPFADEQELHEACKYLFLGTQVVEIGGVKLERPGTTTTLDMEQFSAYIASIKRMAAERWNIWISEAS